MNINLWDEDQLNKPPRNSRREAREAVLQMLYDLHYSDHTLAEVLADVCLPFTPEASKFITDLLRVVIKEKEQLDLIIAENAKNWELSRIYIIDRILLEIAIAEFMYFKDIPPKVSINEAIEIGKRFGTDKSGKFLNGILDACHTQLKKSNRAPKVGRGLLD